MNTAILPPQSEERGKLAHYQLVRKIGQGGMSAVYEAIDEKLKRPVALKILHPYLAEMPEYRARFFREAEACARLTHPNILQIFDVSAKDSLSKLYIVTELISGGTLKERAFELNTFELPELGAMIIAQVCEALEHAHQKNIIHRDIKPENIMITAEGQIKLMDFGIASIGSEESLTQTGTLIGSLAHVAPEVINGQKATARSDIFSLCTVFFWLITKKLPFNADSAHALLKAISDTPIEHPQRLSPYIGDALAAIIEKGLSKNPLDRFDSAALLGRAIDNVLLSMGIAKEQKSFSDVVKNPKQEFISFKNSLFEKIHKQKELYEKSGKGTQALILKCRLDALPKPIFTIKNKTLKPLWQKILLIILFMNSFLIFSDSIYMPIKIRLKELIIEPAIEASESDPIKIETNLPPTETALRQEFVLIIWPFANIILNGKLVAKDAKSFKLKLKAGNHKLAFTHKYAATVEKTLSIDKIEKPIELLINMNKSKPAFLIIKSPQNADVAINGDFKGTSDKSLHHPIVIPMPDRTHSQFAEVIVQKEGFKPIIIKTEFIAGQTKNLSVELVPLS